MEYEMMIYRLTWADKTHYRSKADAKKVITDARATWRKWRDGLSTFKRKNNPDAQQFDAPTVICAQVPPGKDGLIAALNGKLDWKVA